MTPRVILTGAPIDLQHALVAIADSPAFMLEVHADPTLIGTALGRVSARHQVLEDYRLHRKILLELPPLDITRLRLLRSADDADVLAAARRVIHQHLDALVEIPACPVHT